MGSQAALTDPSYRRVPLARGGDGEPFMVPADAAAWRVRRFRNPGRPGACELVYGDDAAPLEIGIDTPISEFKEAVGHRAGRYRLDAIDADGVAVPKLPPAYLQIDATDARPANTNAPAVTVDPTVEALRAVLASNAEMVKLNAELARTNAELARSVIDRFPAMMDSAATLVRAADGAGLPQRTPIDTRNGLPAANDNADDDDDGTDEIQPDAWPTAIMQVVNQLMPMVQALVAHRMGGGVPRNSADPEAPPTKPDAPPTKPTTPRARPASSAPDAEAPASPKQRTDAAPVATMPTAEQLAHFSAVQAGLTPREAQIATALAVQLQPAERAAWLGELAALPVPEAVALIRRHLAQTAPAARVPDRELGVRKPDSPSPSTDDSPNPKESH